MQLTHHDHQPTVAKLPIKLLLNNVRVSANVGNLFRLADAMGVEEIILSGDTEAVPSRKMMRVSRSTHKYVNHCYVQHSVDAIHDLRAQQYKIICLEITDDSTDISSFTLPPQTNICLVIGSEVDGIENAVLTAADSIIHIPMRGQNSSMNVSMATAIALYQLGCLITGK